MRRSPRVPAGCRRNAAAPSSRGRGRRRPPRSTRSGSWRRRAAAGAARCRVRAWRSAGPESRCRVYHSRRAPHPGVPVAEARTAAAIASLAGIIGWSRPPAATGAERLDGGQEPRFVLAIGHDYGAGYLTRGFPCPGFELGSAFTWAVVVRVEEDQDPGARRRQQRDPNGGLQVGLPCKLASSSPVRPRNPNVPRFGFHRQSAEKDRRSGFVTLAFDNRLDDHQRFSNN